MASCVARVPLNTTTPFVVVTPRLASLLLLSAAISDFTAVVIRMSEAAGALLDATGAALDAAGSGLEAAGSLPIAPSGRLCAIPLGAAGVAGTSTLFPPSALLATVAAAG